MKSNEITNITEFFLPLLIIQATVSAMILMILAVSDFTF